MDVPSSPMIHELRHVRDMYEAYQQALAACQQSVGACIRTWRRNNHWTQEQLADRLQVNTEHLSRIENGRKPAGRPLLMAWLAILTETDTSI